MIEFLSSWAKELGLAIVIVSILEMLLPNNKTKKYIRTIIGAYIIFTIISPFIKNKDMFDLNNINLEEYGTTQASTTTKVDQTSMNERIEELYIGELEKDITKKLKEKGYEITQCKVKVQIADNEEETKIIKIKVNVGKLIEETQTISEENQNNLENQIVAEIQKIKPIDTSINSKNNNINEKNEEKSTNIDKTDIQNIKKFLIEEYGVNEKCLEIN